MRSDLQAAISTVVESIKPVMEPLTNEIKKTGFARDNLKILLNSHSPVKINRRINPSQRLYSDVIKDNRKLIIV